MTGRRRGPSALTLGVFIIAGLLLAGPAGAAPMIALVIDDMGRSPRSGQAVLDLPGPLACAFLPYAPYTRDLAEAAHRRGKEVLLHLPMQSMEHRPLDRGALLLDMSEAQVVATLRDDLARVPHVIGVNNHMGSLLTRHPGHMLWVMRELKRSGDLFFLDSRTSADTVARLVALENDVPSVSRHVFLDDDPAEAAVERQFERLLAVAERRGAAIAIGHPRPATLRVLERALPRLEERGVRLVPASTLVKWQQERDKAWLASSSPWHRVVKNWKRLR